MTVHMDKPNTEFPSKKVTVTICSSFKKNTLFLPVILEHVCSDRDLLHFYKPDNYFYVRTIYGYYLWLLL
jgi:hypothetical protein